MIKRKGRDHSRPLRFSAWRRYQVRRDISSLSQGFLASMVRVVLDSGTALFRRLFDLHQEKRGSTRSTYTTRTY